MPLSTETRQPVIAPALNRCDSPMFMITELRYALYPIRPLSISRSREALHYIRAPNSHPIFGLCEQVAFRVLPSYSQWDDVASNGVRTREHEPRLSLRPMHVSPRLRWPARAHVYPVFTAARRQGEGTARTHGGYGPSSRRCAKE